MWQVRRRARRPSRGNAAAAKDDRPMNDPPPTPYGDPTDVLLQTGAEPIPGYRLLERLGRGGFGEVWKAEAPGGLMKAIKFVFGDLDGGAGDNRPAEQELKALNRVKTIRHPYILSLERVDIIDGQLLIVMELAD